MLWTSRLLLLRPCARARVRHVALFVIIRESTRLAREPRPCCDAVVGRICCCGARGLVGGNLRFDTSAAPRRFECRAGVPQRVCESVLKGEAQSGPARTATRERAARAPSSRPRRVAPSTLAPVPRGSQEAPRAGSLITAVDETRGSPRSLNKHEPRLPRARPDALRRRAQARITGGGARRRGRGPRRREAAAAPRGRPRPHAAHVDVRPSF